MLPGDVKPCDGLRGTTDGTDPAGVFGGMGVRGQGDFLQKVPLPP